MRADVATPRALGALGADRRRVSRFGPGLIDALAQSRALVPARVWPKPGMLSRSDKKRVDELMSRLREVAREAGIAASLLATRREVEALVLGGGARLTRGWRRELVGEAVSLEAS